jgi:hypothetical protein
MAKSAPIAFQPAPRPHPRVTPDQTRELAEATRDLGFGRTTSAPDAEGEPAASPPPAAAKAPATVAPPAPTGSPEVREAAARRQAARPASPMDTVKRSSALKFDVPDELWTALRREALDRRVTVKYLVLEALAEKGYAVDLSAIPEDGRRLR